MRAATIVCFAAALGLTAPGNAAARGAPTAEAPDAAAFFHLGELYEANTWAYYYQTSAGKVEERFAAFESECRRLGAPADVLENLDACRKGRLAMPFLSRPWSTWTPEESQRWAGAPPLRDDVWTAWLNKPDYQPRFFWQLGRMSFMAWFIVGRDVLERGADLRSSEKNLRTVVRIASVISTDTGYAKARERLSPEAAAALKALADLSGPMDDPFGEGVTLEQCKAIDAAARTLRDLARAKTLTAATPAHG